jgi:hypothetical protein
LNENPRDFGAAREGRWGRFSLRRGQPSVGMEGWGSGTELRIEEEGGVR